MTGEHGSTSGQDQPGSQHVWSDYVDQAGEARIRLSTRSPLATSNHGETQGVYETQNDNFNPQNPGGLTRY